MTRYNPALKQPPPPKQGPSDIVRGAGCFISAIIPFISFFGAYTLVGIGVEQNWPFPYQLMGHPAIHPLLWKIVALIPLWGFIQAQDNLYAVLSLTFLLIIILQTVSSSLFSFAYRAAVPRYGPLDVPPPNIKVKPHKR